MHSTSDYSLINHYHVIILYGHQIDEDDDDVLAYTVSGCYRYYQYSAQKTTQMEVTGCHEALLRHVADLHGSDQNFRNAYQNLFQTSPVRKVSPCIDYIDTNWMKAISTDERIVGTLRFLATGDKDVCPLSSVRYRQQELLAARKHPTRH